MHAYREDMKQQFVYVTTVHPGIVNSKHLIIKLS